MRRFTHLIALVAAAQLACTSSPPGTQSSGDPAAVRRAGQAYLAALRTSNIDSMLAHWTDSATVLPPNEPVVRGRAAFRAFGEAFFRQLRVVDAEFTESDVTIGGDLAVERVAFSLTLQPVAGGAPITDVGKGVHVYRRQADGTWKLTMDIWNADAPPKP